MTLNQLLAQLEAVAFDVSCKKDLTCKVNFSDDAIQVLITIIDVVAEDTNLAPRSDA